MPFRKKKPNLVRNVVISSESFMYIAQNRRNNREPFYKVLDRVLKQHERLTKDKDLKEEKEDHNFLDNR